MGGKHGKMLPGREQTDESLRSERKNADVSAAKARVAVQKDADAVLDLARGTADALLSDERDLADRRLALTENRPWQRAGSDPEARDEVVRERALADEVVRSGRATADETLRREREAYALALETLLPLERDETNRYLLTERARSDDSLSHRDEFLGIVSHDLRNLLGGIVHSAELLRDDAPDTEEGRQVVVGAKRIQRYVARMDTLIGDLLDVASIEAGKLAVTPARADAAALVEEAVETFRVVAQEKKISLESVLGEPAIMGDLDYERMLQVLGNLITNALKFTQSGGVVRVRAERAGDELRLSVTDTGQGIPADMLVAVFQRFWQVGKNDRRGQGLGLYISKHIVEAHGGKIWAESKLGEGSQMFVTLPSAASGPASRS